MKTVAAAKEAPASHRIEDDDLLELPLVAQDLMRLLMDPDLSNEKFSRQIQGSDPTGLVRQIIETANSPFYGGRVPIRTLSDAIARIGRRQLYEVVMMAAVGTLYADPLGVLKKHWEHSIATGVIGSVLSETLQMECRAEAFTAGLLHDIGKVLIFRKYPSVFKFLAYRAEVLRCLWWEAERERFPGLEHCSTGARVAEHWGFSPQVIEAIRRHHEPEKPDPEGREFPPLVCVVSLASIIADNMGLGHPHYDWDDALRLPCARGIGFTPAHLVKVQARASLLFKPQEESSCGGIGLVDGEEGTEPAGVVSRVSGDVDKAGIAAGKSVSRMVRAADVRSLRKITILRDSWQRLLGLFG